MKIGFYIVGKKGYFTLANIIAEFGIDFVGFVVCAKDSNIAYDWYDEVCNLCSNIKQFYTKGVDVIDEKKLSASVDYRFAIGWRWIIAAYDNLIIFHDSILPKYRGFSPLVCMMINGEKFFGVTALIASQKYDEGLIISQEKIYVDYDITISELIDLIIPLYCKLAVDICERIIKYRKISGVQQDELLASYSMWRDDDDYFVDWSRDSKYICRFISAVGYPYLGAKAVCNGEVVRIMSSELYKDCFIQGRDSAIGKVFVLVDECPVVVCGDGMIKLTDIRNSSGSCIIGKLKLKTRFLII